MSLAIETPAPTTTASRPPIWPLAVLGGLLAWAYYPMLAVFADKWVNDPQYSHGFLVPIFSGYLLRSRWKAAPVEWNPMPVLGCGLLVLVLGMRLVAGSLLFHQLDAASLLIALAAISLAAGGWSVPKRTGPAIAFLVFMSHCPTNRANVGQPSRPGRRCAARSCSDARAPAIRDGNLILIDEVRLGVWMRAASR